LQGVAAGEETARYGLNEGGRFFEKRLAARAGTKNFPDYAPCSAHE